MARDLPVHGSAGALAGAVAGGLTGALDALLSGAPSAALLSGYLAATGVAAGALLGFGAGLLSWAAALRGAPRAAEGRWVGWAVAAAILAALLPPLCSLFGSAFRNRELAALALVAAVATLAALAALAGGAARGLWERLSPRGRAFLGAAPLLALGGALAWNVARYAPAVGGDDARALGLGAFWVLGTTAGRRWLTRRRFRFGVVPWMARRAALVVAVAGAYAGYQLVTGGAPRAVAAARPRVALYRLAMAEPEGATSAAAPAAPRPPARDMATPAGEPPRAPARPPERPSLVLVTIDSARADRFSLYGYPRPTTPRLDAWAQRCVVFQRAYAASSAERDALPALLSGRLPSQLVRSASRWPRHARANRFLAEALRSRGYHTAAVVAHDAHGRSSGLAHGFESFDVSPARPGERLLLTRFTSAQVAARARSALERSRGRPLFLWAHFADPHRRYLARSEKSFGRLRSDRYDSEVASTDEHLGAVLAAVETAGGAAWVVVAGDHGEALGERGRWGHGSSLSEPEIRVPLVVCAPGVAPARVAVPVSTLDIYPTLLEAAGAQAPRGAAGISLAPFLRGRAEDRGPVLAEIAEAPGVLPQVALVDRDHKLVLSGAGRIPRVYDLRADPGERRNLARAQPALAARLQSVLRKLRAPGLAGAPARRLRGVMSAADDAAEAEALRRAQEAQKRREEMGLP